MSVSLVKVTQPATAEVFEIVSVPLVLRVAVDLGHPLGALVPSMPAEVLAEYLQDVLDRAHELLNDGASWAVARFEEVK